MTPSGAGESTLQVPSRRWLADAGRGCVGVDLAWGPNADTGLAALTPAGTLVEATQVRTDDQIIQWLRRVAPDPGVVAFDAPLVVVNPSGQRPCERLVARYFGGRGAGCHPSNTSRPHFRDGGRARHLSTALGLDLGLARSGRRRAIEVYPHAAIVALFDLPAIVRYKAKPARDLPALRTELLRLLDLVESLASADPALAVRGHPDWERVRGVVAGAGTKARLRSVEDTVDAVVCAYVALLAARNDSRLRALGDPRTGCIVTPVTPSIAARIAADAEQPPRS